MLTLMYGYGGFNENSQPGYDPQNLALMNNLGGMYVVVNIRGGGEYGEKWHTAAIKEHKQRSYDDWIAAAEYLIDRGYTDSSHLTMNGASNGGTLVAAVANQRPDLFAGVISEVPVTDMLRYHKFTEGP